MGFGHRQLFKHKQLPGGASGGPYVSPYLLEILSTRSGAPSWPVATGSVVANTGQVLTNTRGTAAYCLDRSNVPVMLGRFTVRAEAAGLLREDARKNYHYSSTMGVNGPSNIGWNKFNNGGSAQPVVTFNTTDVTDPTGENYATKIVFDAVNASGDLSDMFDATVSFATGLGRGSMWMRAPAGQSFTIVYSNNGHATFAAVTDQWTRFSVSLGFGQVWVGNEFDALGGAQPARTVYFWGCQAEDYFVTSFHPTTTNLIAYSENIGAAPWVIQGTTGYGYGFTAPDGTATAARATFPGGTLAGGQVDSIFQPTNSFWAYQQNGPVTCSVWLKGSVAGNFNIWFMDNTAVPYVQNWWTEVTVALTTSWQKFTFTVSGPTGCPGTGGYFGIGYDGNDPGLVGATLYSGDVYMWGAQVACGEGSAYWPTYATVTDVRAADYIEVDNPLSPLSQPVPAWSASCKATPLLNDWTYQGDSGISVLLNAGNINANYNSLRLLRNGSNTDGYADVVDNAAGFRGLTLPNALTSFPCFLGASGTDVAQFTGSPGGGGYGGAGTGIILDWSIRANPNITLGSPSSLTNFALSGHMTDIVVDNTVLYP